MLSIPRSIHAKRPSAPTRRRCGIAPGWLGVLGMAWLLTGQAAAADDEWTSGDKRAHFVGGLLIGGIASRNTGSVGPGVLAGCGAGVLGELIEAARYGWVTPRVSAKDFGAECAGGLVGAIVGRQLAPSGRVAASREARPRDRWFSADKFWHFTGGATVGGLVAHYTESATAGLLAGCGMSATGELIDAARHGWHSRHTSAKDFAAGCAGAITASFVSVEVAPDRIRWNRSF